MPTLTAPDGTLLVYDMYEAAAPRAAILALHGWADHAGRWRDVGERLCAAGYSTYVLDLRGHGRSGGRRGHLSRFSQLLGDLQAFRRVVRLGPTARSCCSAPRSAGWWPSATWRPSRATPSPVPSSFRRGSVWRSGRPPGNVSSAACLPICGPRSRSPPGWRPTPSVATRW